MGSQEQASESPTVFEGVCRVCKNPFRTVTRERYGLRTCSSCGAALVVPHTKAVAALYRAAAHEHQVESSSVRFEL